MSMLADVREQKRADQAAAEQRRQDAADREAARRRDERAARINRAAVRKADRRASLARYRAAVPGAALSALWATMIVLPICLAWTAQAAFAAETLQIGWPWAHAFPAAIECGAWLCAFESYRRIHRGMPVGSLPRWMWILAGVAAVINASHGIADGGLPAGLALGALSLLGVLLHSIRQSLDADASGAPRRVGLAIWRRVRYPRLSLAAASLRAARELDHATAWRLAWHDRYGVGPDSTLRDRRLGRVIVHREERADRKAAKSGELTLIDGRVQRTQANTVRGFVTAHERAALQTPFAANPDPDSTASNSVTEEVTDPDTTEVRNVGSTGSEQEKLTGRAAALLPALHEAIAAEAIPPNPSVKRIRTWARDYLHEPLGVPTAQALRDAVTGLHLITDPAQEVP